MQKSLIVPTLALAALLAVSGIRLQATAQSPVVTRAQAVTSLLLSRSPVLPAVDTTKRFADLEPGVWYEAYMRVAEQDDIIEADPKGRLLPDQPINRAEFLKMLTHTFGLPDHLPFVFTDVPASAWYARYAGLAEEFHLFPGDSNTTKLSPQKLLTEREASAALESILRAIGKLPQDRLTDEARTEQHLSADQVARKLNLYLVISTQRLRVRLMKQAPAAPDTEPATDVAPAAQKTLRQLRSELMTLVNRARTQAGLRPLRYNTMLQRSSQAFAEDMAQRGYFSHVSPEGATLKDRIQESGYRDRSFQNDCFCVKGYFLAENLARGQRTPEEAMQAWMNSLSHRAAILSPGYKEIGFGVAAGFWVQHFGAVVLPTEVMVKTTDGSTHGAGTRR